MAQKQAKRDAKPLKLSDYLAEYDTVARRGEVWGLLEWFWNNVIVGNLPHRLFIRWITRQPYVVFNPWRLARLRQAQEEAQLEQPAAPPSIEVAR